MQCSFYFMHHTNNYILAFAKMQEIIFVGADLSKSLPPAHSAGEIAIMVAKILF